MYCTYLTGGYERKNADQAREGQSCRKGTAHNVLYASPDF